MSLKRVCTPTRIVTYCILLSLALLLSYYRHALTQSTIVVVDEEDVHVAVPFAASRTDWSKYTFKNKLDESDFYRLPKGDFVTFPQLQHDFPPRFAPKEGLSPQQETRAEIKTAFTKAWASYEQHAWGLDELEPLGLEKSKFVTGWATFMIESLDTLWLMDMKPEFYRAATYIARMDLDNATTEDFDVFELNARQLGGLISAYELSDEEALLNKAIELADFLYAAFDNPLHMPAQYIKVEELKNGKEQPENEQRSGKLGSMALEFTRLSQITGNTKYYDAVHRITRNLERTQLSTHLTGLWPMEISTHKSFDVSQKTFGLGGGGDAVYEYLLKEHILLEGREPVYGEMYNTSVESMIKHLVYRPMLPEKDDVLMLGNVEFNWRRKQTFIPALEHLTCATGGMFVLGGRIFGKEEQIDIGEKLTRGCVYAYQNFPDGLMPDRSVLEACPTLDPCEYEPTDNSTSPAGFTVKDARYAIRPEAIESLFVLYRVTGLPDLQDVAWNMWKSIKNATETDTFTTPSNGSETEIETEERTPLNTYPLAQTLKYLWLMFSDEDVMSLDQWVFNTEGHPFRRS